MTFSEVLRFKWSYSSVASRQVIVQSIRVKIKTNFTFPDVESLCYAKVICLAGEILAQMNLDLFQVFVFLHKGWPGLIYSGNYCLTAGNCTHVYLVPISITNESTDFLLKFIDIIFVVILRVKCSSFAALTLAF